MPTELWKMLEIERLLRMKKLQTERALRRTQDRLDQLRSRARTARAEGRAVLGAAQADQLEAHMIWRAGQTRQAVQYETEIEAMTPDIAALQAATRQATKQSLAIEEIIADLRLREDLEHEEAEEKKREAATQMQTYKTHQG